MHRVRGKNDIRLGGLVITAVMVVAAAGLGGSCFLDTKTTLCEASGLRCRPGQVCAAAQDVCIDIGGCGDGTVGGAEVCDDGNIVDGDDCSADCTSNEICGNGKIDRSKGEFCDDGNRQSGDGCSADCSPEMCGDGFVDKDLGEVCDDGNGLSSDGCRADCRSNEACGNGIMDPHLGEQCEFAGPPPPFPHPVPNAAGCDSDCTLPLCGDGHLNPMNLVSDSGSGHPEECDTEGDSASCDKDCTPARCGDGYKNMAAGEECDSSGLITSGCNGYLCTEPRCGDNFLNPHTEVCDAGGNVEACDGNCTLPACGDQYVNPSFKPPGRTLGETCDDGNANNSDFCPDGTGGTCRDAVCGDGYKRTQAPNPEQCDDGNADNGDSCPDGTGGTCKDAFCGDGHRRTQGSNLEQCDDGNTSNNDFCVGTCKNATCGDGFVRTQGANPEQCDNGTANDDDTPNACRPDCRNPFCGDGVKDAGEVCDPGGSYGNGDTCTGTPKCLPNCSDCV